MVELTKEERAAVDSMIKRKISKGEVAFSYAIYIVPSLLFAIYALWKQDFVASLVAYSALLIVVVWYLAYSFSSGKHLYLALVKYENATEVTQGNFKDKT